MTERPARAPLILQWHLTERCPLACLHCYREPGPEASPDVWREILGQFRDLLRALGGPGGPRKGRLHLTGGEPFLAEGFLDFLEWLRNEAPELSFAILTTGLPVDAPLARRLKRLGPRFIQVSLDGSPATHDRLRGPGNHARVLEAIRTLSREGLRVSVSFTALRGTWREFPAVVEASRAAGAATVWTDRLVPCGQARDLEHEVLGPGELPAYVRMVGQERKRLARRPFCRTQVQAGRALQFRASPEPPYRCSAGRSLLALLPDGTLLPCRRMPIPLGRLPQDDLVRIYQEHGLLIQLRDPRKVPAGCAACPYAGACGGGLRCLAWALGGDPFLPDPACDLAGSFSREPAPPVHCPMP